MWKGALKLLGMLAALALPATPLPSLAQSATPESGAPVALSTPAFEPGGPISWRYTCYNIREPSPPVSWSGVPPGAGSVALVMDAPERPAGIFTQWVIFNIPPDLAELPEDIPKTDRLSNGALQGRNDFGGIGFAAPCPPVLTTATYILTLYVLKTTLSLPPGASEADVEDAAASDLLAEVQVSCTYLRPAWPWG